MSSTPVRNTTRRKARPYQQNQHRRVWRQRAVVAGDPVEGHGSVVGGAEAFAPECDGGERPREGGEDGLDVAVRREHGEGAVGAAEAVEAGEEAAPRAGDLEGRVWEERLLLSGGAAWVGVLGGGDGGGGGGERHGGGWEEQVAEARGEAAGGAGEWGWRL